MNGALTIGAKIIWVHRVTKMQRKTVWKVAKCIEVETGSRKVIQHVVQQGVFLRKISQKMALELGWYGNQIEHIYH